MRWPHAAALALALPLVGACSETHDAWFANPCAEPLTVRTFYAEGGEDVTEPSDEMIAEAELAAEAVTKVDDAFQDAAGSTWFVEVVGGPTLRVTKDEMPKWFVSLPATVCEEA